MTDDWAETILTDPGLIDSEAPQKALLVIVRGTNVGKGYPVTGPSTVIGRATGADLQLPDEGVSRFHCKLRQERGEVLVEDLGSRNGTFCNGQRVDAPRALAEGDRLQIGTTIVMRFTYAEAELEATPDPENQTATTDSLTGTYSRRYFIDRLEADFVRVLEQRMLLSLVLLHIDRYNEIAASHGQDFAEQLTISIADKLRGVIRKTDVLARISNSDFALIRYASSPGDTFMLAERLRTSSSGLTIPDQDGDHKVTFSIGVASMNNELPIQTAHDLLLAAGNTLHRVRSLGGNRVAMCTHDLLREPTNQVKV